MALTKVTTHVIADDIALGGNPTTTTQSAGNNTTRIATTAFVTGALADLTDSAPSTLNTLNELAAALGDDANFSTTVTNSIAAKLPLAGGTMTGALNMGSQNITSVNRISTADGIADTGAAGSSTIFNESGSTADFRIESDSNTHMFFLDGGLNKIGINTSSPDELLHVKGANGAIAIDGDGSNNTASIKFINDNERSRITSAYGSGGGGVLTFHTDSTGGSLLERMRIDASGNVGIGTTSPGTALQVGDGTGDAFITIDKSTTGSSGILLKNAGNDKIKLLANALEEFELHVNNALAMYVKEGGNVGIGTSSPGALLDLSGVTASSPPKFRLSGTGEASAGDTIGQIDFHSGDTTDNTAGIMASIKAIAGPSGGNAIKLLS